MVIMTDRTDTERLAAPGLSAMDANQSLTCSTLMASTARWRKVDEKYEVTIQCSAKRAASAAVGLGERPAPVSAVVQPYT